MDDLRFRCTGAASFISRDDAAAERKLASAGNCGFSATEILDHGPLTPFVVGLRKAGE